MGACRVCQGAVHVQTCAAIRLRKESKKDLQNGSCTAPFIVCGARVRPRSPRLHNVAALLGCSWLAWTRAIINQALILPDAPTLDLHGMPTTHAKATTAANPGQATTSYPPEHSEGHQLSTGPDPGRGRRQSHPQKLKAGTHLYGKECAPLPAEHACVVPERSGGAMCQGAYTSEDCLHGRSAQTPRNHAPPTT